MNPLVSIIIPCYNNEAFVEQAIKSAIAQTYENKEIIVIDDGSTDDSLAKIRSFKRQIIWESQENKGAPRARNRGLALAKGKYVKFLDADDFLLPDTIEKQLTQAEKIPQTHKKIVYGDAQWVDIVGEFLTSVAPRAIKAEESPIAHILSQCPLTSCPLHRKDYLVEIGGFDPTIPKGQERDLHLRLVLAGVHFEYHAGTVYHYREYQSAQRISNRALSEKDAMIHFNILESQQQKIQSATGKELEKSMKSIFAQQYWSQARVILREGNATAAEAYFKAAYALSPNDCVKGNAPYPMLVKVFGSRIAERLVLRLKQVFN